MTGGAAVPLSSLAQDGVKTAFRTSRSAGLLHAQLYHVAGVPAIRLSRAHVRAHSVPPYAAGLDGPAHRGIRAERHRQVPLGVLGGCWSNQQLVGQ
jgi:hypothetical protein